jgi:hypothetical protein
MAPQRGLAGNSSQAGSRKNAYPSDFFKRVGHHKEFEKYLGNGNNPYLPRFTKAWTAFKNELDKLANA